MAELDCALAHTLRVHSHLDLRSTSSVWLLVNLFDGRTLAPLLPYRAAGGST